MNTIEDLTEHYGFEVKTAQMMLDCYEKRIGSMSGVLQITDVDYIGKGTKEITLKCTNCNKEYKAYLRNGSNKWSDLRYSCDCQIEVRRREKQQKKEQEIKDKLEGEIGKIYGDFEVIGYNNEKGVQKTLDLKCQVCGYERTMSYSQRKPHHCTKHFKEKFDESYIGKKNNRLTILKYITGKDGRKTALCQCECGNLTVTKPTFWEKGLVKSCGCLADEARHRKWAETDPSIIRLRHIRSGMIQRCYNAKSKPYKYYGARGITVCEEWQGESDAFVEWALKNGYRDDLTIDRIDVNGNYEPNNCRWADWFTQANNKRPKGGEYVFNGEPQSLKYIAEQFNVPKSAIEYRIKRGMELVDAINIVLKRKREGYYAKNDN